MTALLTFAADLIGYCGVAAILIGVLLALRQWIRTLYNHEITYAHVRLTLGTYILLALEFMVGQDIILSVLHRDLESIAELGLVVLIRTILDIFLSKEMEHLESRIESHKRLEEKTPSLDVRRQRPADPSAAQAT